MTSYLVIFSILIFPNVSWLFSQASVPSSKFSDIYSPSNLSNPSLFEGITYSQQYGQATSKNKNRNGFRLLLKYQHPFFAVDIGLGTPAIQNTLMFNIRRELTWTQCQPCSNCFKQDKPFFDMRSSTSYTRMTARNKLSTNFRFSCNQSVCLYHEKDVSFGIVSFEKFYFQTSNGEPLVVRDLMFGCGIRNWGIGSSAFTGILGMGPSPPKLSFPIQLRKQIKCRFSYCFPSISFNKTKDSYLRFGDQAVIRTNNVQSTIYTTSEKTEYALSLEGFRVNGERLRIKDNYEFYSLIMSSADDYTILTDKMFRALQESVERHFVKAKIVRTSSPSPYHDFLCYSIPEGFTNFPKMTLNFVGMSNLHLPQENLFIRAEKNTICLAFRIGVGAKNKIMLGIYQQQNIRFLYDVCDKKVSFAHENCSNDVVNP